MKRYRIGISLLLAALAFGAMPPATPEDALHSAFAPSPRPVTLSLIPATAVGALAPQRAGFDADETAVFECLRRLAALGYGPYASAAPDASSRAATRFYQQEHRLSPTGQLDPSTIKALGCQ